MNYYYECFFNINELGFTTTSGIHPYTRTHLTKDEIPYNLSVLNTFNIPKNKNQFELPYHY
jgi:hypothetical protein